MRSDRRPVGKLAIRSNPPNLAFMSSLACNLGVHSITPLLGLNIEAEKLPLFQDLPFFAFLTNSIFVALIVLTVLLVVAVKATTNMKLIPHAWQNFFEFVVEFLYNQVEGIVGKKVAPQAFPLLATTFLFILIANWMGLFPGVGTAGWEILEEGQVAAGPATVNHVDIPLIRPATADLNMTLGIAVTFMLLWFFITMKETGPWGFIKHTFFPPEGIKGAMWAGLLIIFMFVGVIEIISIVFRPVSLSLRLFGNLFAGENLLHVMGDLGNIMGFPPVLQFISSVLFPLPFYFLEILVGLLQAIVFTLLCAVYIKLSTAHSDHGEHH